MKSLNNVCHITCLRVAMMAAALICLVAIATSCRTIKEVEHQYIHDTVTVVEKEYIHDTLQTTQIKHDSVDRYIEKVIYVDENGVVHEREIERLTRILRESNEEYHIKEAEYENTIHELKEQLENNVQTVEVAKPLNWFQKTMMGLGVCFIITVIGCIIYLYFRIKTKIKNYG